MNYYCEHCKEQRVQGCFGPRCPGITRHSPTLHEQAKSELLLIERHIAKRHLTDQFSLTALWMLVEPNGSRL